MRIISSKKDYYDGVAAHGVDMSLLFLREPKDAIFEQGWCFPVIPTTNFDATCHVIGFCGKVYPAIHLLAPGMLRYESKPADYMFYDLEHVDAFMRKHLKKATLENYENGKHRVRNYYYNRENTHAYWENFFERFKGFQDKFEKVFQDFKVPTFVISSNNRKHREKSPWGTDQGIVLNPILKEFAFAKVKDPYTAFQDLRMWLSNTAQPDRPMLSMSDQENANRLGHGGKYSFRKPPAKV